MELLKTIRRRSFLSESVYVALNIALAVAVLIIVWTVESPVPALLLVLLSKWRIFAVRPRYWVANIQANLVDIIVNVSAVMLMYSVVGMTSGLLVQAFLAVLYAVWLIVLKPRSTTRAVVSQAATALVAGTMVLFVSSYSWPIEIVVLAMAGLGYVVTRHALVRFKEDHLQFLALTWAFVMAQLGWVLSHWVIAYTVPILEIRIPQAVLVISAISFVAYKVYVSYKQHEQVRSVDVMLPILFSVSIIFVLMVFFSNIPIGTL